MDQTKEPTTYDDYLNTPVHAQPMGSLLVAIPRRLVGLISKLIGVKMLLFAVATYLAVTVPDTFPWYAWIIVYIVTIFGWDGLKWIEHIKK